MFEYKSVAIALLCGAITWQELNNRAYQQEVGNMKEEMSNLKEAQALTQEALKTEKVNRLTQMRNLKKQDSMPEATEMIETQEEDS